MEVTGQGFQCCRYLSRRTEIRWIFVVLVLPVLLYTFKYWPICVFLKSRLNSRALECITRLLASMDFVSNQPLYPGMGMRFVTCIIRECQIRLLVMLFIFRVRPYLLFPLQWGSSWIDGTCWPTTRHMMTADETVSRGYGH